MSNSKIGGRPKTPINPITAERMISLRYSHKESQEDIGRVIGYGKATIGRYENQKRGIAPEDLKRLAQHWNVPVDYLTGITDCTTEEAYQMEQFELACENYEKEQEKQLQKINQIRALFSLCGFQYANIPQTPRTEVSHVITDSSSGFTVTLNDTELQTLIEHIHFTIQVEGSYIKSKQA